MATALQLGDIIALRAWTVLGDQAAVNTYNYEVITVTGGAVTDQDVVSDFDTLKASPFYTSLCPPGVDYKGCQLYFMKRSPFLPGPVFSITGAGPGVVGVNPLPRNTAPILKYSTGVRGPIGRGRLFLPFASTTYMDSNGKPTAGFDTLVNSFASALLNPYGITVGASSVALVWSLLHRIVGPPKSVATVRIIQALAADKFGQLHKRGDYGRANLSPI